MAALSGATLSTSLDDTVPTEWIRGQILDAPRSASIEDMICWQMKPPPGGRDMNAAVIQIPRLDAIAPTLTEAAPLAETDEFAAIEQTTAQNTVTMAHVGIRKAPSDQAGMFSRSVGLSTHIGENIAAMKLRRTTDVLLQILNATTTKDYSTLSATMLRLQLAKTALLGLKNPLIAQGCRIALVAHSWVVGSLVSEMISTGSSWMANSSVELEVMKSRSVYAGMLPIGIEVWQTDAAPQYDANNWSSGLVLVSTKDENGERAVGSGLVIADWLGDGTGTDPGAASPYVTVGSIKTEIDRQVNRSLTDVVSHSFYGTGLSTPTAIVEFVTSKTV